MPDGDSLPSWRPGRTRDAITEFLESAHDLPTEQRVACFDNDGTLWCERPTYVQYDFFVDALKTRARDDPSVSEAPEFAALLSGDREAVGKIGLERIALALTGLFEGFSPQEFTARVRDFMSRAIHPTLGRPLRSNTYQPMLELIAELRRRDFSVFIATGGGTEFLRAISQDLYGIPPESVVGSLIAYEYVAADARSGPGLRRAARLIGDANEGAAKVTNIQTQLGRRPILAAGNSGGDREMLEWAASVDGPTLTLLVDHDDPAREFAYASTAGTFIEPEPITEVATRQNWTVISMARDWESIFAGQNAPGGGSLGGST